MLHKLEKVNHLHNITIRITIIIFSLFNRISIVIFNLYNFKHNFIRCIIM